MLFNFAVHLFCDERMAAKLKNSGIKCFRDSFKDAFG